MSFETILAAQTPRRSGVTCHVEVFRAGLSVEDAAAFDTALRSTDVPGSEIHRAMRTMGFTGRVDNLQRHRRRDCTCVIR